MVFDYHCGRWRSKRKKILHRDKYICQHFKRYGKNREAQTVHHIYPAKDYPEYAWCDWNLISLSYKAHELMHKRDSGELTDIGIALMRRTIPPGS